MTIEWKKVTWYSQTLAVVLGLLIFGVGYWIGSERINVLETVEPSPVDEGPVTVSYQCADDKALIAVYESSRVSLKLSDGRDIAIPQVAAASGIRYANDDESFVFWSKGTTAFITEGEDETYAGCNEAPIPV